MTLTSSELGVGRAPSRRHCLVVLPDGGKLVYLAPLLRDIRANELDLRQVLSEYHPHTRVIPRLHCREGIRAELSHGVGDAPLERRHVGAQARLDCAALDCLPEALAIAAGVSLGRPVFLHHLGFDAQVGILMDTNHSDTTITSF